MKKLILRNAVIGLTMMQSLAANAGKESGNALILLNGSTAYRSQLCVEESDLEDFSKKKNFEVQFSELKDTVKRFHPGLAQQTSQRIRVCVTERPIGSLLGLGDSDLRVAGYISEYRGDQKKFTGQAPYIFISKKYLDGKPAAINLAEITFAETLHSAFNSEGYSVDNLRLEQAMTIIIDFKGKELNSENLIAFDDHLKQIDFPSLSDIPMGLTDIKSINKYLQLSKGKVNVDIPTVYGYKGNTYGAIRGFYPEALGYVRGLLTEDAAKFFDLLDQYDLTVRFAIAPTNLLMQAFLLSSIGLDGETKSYYPKKIDEINGVVPEQLKYIISRMQRGYIRVIEFADSYFADPEYHYDGSQISYFMMNDISGFRLNNIHFLIENNVINPDRDTIGHFLGRGPINRVLLAYSVMNLSKDNKYKPLVRRLLKSKNAPRYNVLSIDGQGVQRLLSEIR